MIDAPLGFAFAAGVVAAFNPCGFALLPAYLTRFLGQSLTATPSEAAAWPGALRRALRVSAALTAGFVIVFLVAGALITEASVTVQRATPFVSVVIGLVLAAGGVATAIGWKPSISLPRLQRGGRDGSFLSVALFGVSYATVSLSCTIPAFLVAVSGTFERHGFANGIAVFVSYALGMGAVLTVLTVAVGVGGHQVLRRVRSSLAVLPRLGGALLAVTGLYVAYYGAVEIALERGHNLPTGPVDLVGDASGNVVTLLDGRHWLVAAVAVAAVVAAAGALTLRRTRRPGVDQPA
ncbi:MAG: cytochrome c biogenesis protein CcdA [Actinobacteria bacterium]|nr:cytochrome c biogenesis protein CcdA [Actinomycetota bacterium]